MSTWFSKGAASNSIWLKGGMYTENYGREPRDLARAKVGISSIPCQETSFLLKKRNPSQILRKAMI